MSKDTKKHPPDDVETLDDIPLPEKGNRARIDILQETILEAENRILWMQRELAEVGALIPRDRKETERLIVSLIVGVNALDKEVEMRKLFLPSSWLW